MPFVQKNFLLRKVTADDCHDLWLWRNHLKTRKMSINSEEIPYQSHCEWFNKKSADKNSVIYIVSGNDNHKIGQARLEMQGNRAQINLSLNPSFIGRGLGKVVVSLVTDKFLEEYTHIETIVAEILKSNAASQKIFKNKGYVFSSEGIKNKKVIDVYVFKRTRQ